jgi:hypothetical protein
MEDNSERIEQGQRKYVISAHAAKISEAPRACRQGDLMKKGLSL